MSINLSLSIPQQILAGRCCNAVLTMVDADGGGPYTLVSINIGEATESDAVVSPPNIAAPNSPVGIGTYLIPTTVAGLSLPFAFVINSPFGAGPSPQNAPGGAAPSPNAATPDANFTLLVNVAYKNSAGVVSVASLAQAIWAISTISPFPLAQGGALQLSQGANLINLVMLGAL